MSIQHACAHVPRVRPLGAGLRPSLGAPGSAASRVARCFHPCRGGRGLRALFYFSFLLPESTVKHSMMQQHQCLMCV